MNVIEEVLWMRHEWGRLQREIGWAGGRGCGQPRAAARGAGGSGVAVAGGLDLGGLRERLYGHAAGVRPRPCNWFRLPTAVGTRPQKECGGRSLPDMCVVPTFRFGRARADPRVVS